MRFEPVVLALILLVGCPGSREPRGWEEPPADGVAITCAVSGERCSKTPETPAAIYRDRTYYFCRPELAVRFAERPEAYADPPRTP